MAPPWLEPRGNIFKVVDKLGEHDPTFFYLSIDESKKRLEYYNNFCSICCGNVFWFNIQLAKKRVTDGRFLFSCKTLVFVVATFLNFGAKMRCPQNRYTDLKSVVFQSLKTKYSYMCYPIHPTEMFKNNLP